MNSSLAMYSRHLNRPDDVLEHWVTEAHSCDGASTVRADGHPVDQYQLNYVAYSSNELGSASDFHQGYHGSNCVPASTSQYNAGNSYGTRSLYQYNGSAAHDSFSLNHAVMDPFVKTATIGYGDEDEGLQYKQEYRDSTVAISGGQYWELPSSNNPSLYNNVGYYPAEPCHSQMSTGHSVPILSHGDDSHVPAVSQLQDYNWGVGSETEYLEHRTHATSRDFFDDHEVLLQSTLTTPSQQYLANPPGGNLRDAPLTSNNPYFSPQHVSPPTSTHPTITNTSPPVRRKRARLQGWPDGAHHRNKELDSTNSLLPSSSSYAVDSAPSYSTLSSSHHYRISPDRSPAAGRQGAIALSAADPTLPNSKPNPAAKKGNLDRKQTLACLFCRERKIACGRPAAGSADHTCNQCARRHFKCEYPKESRRGQHKRCRKKAHDVKGTR